MFADLARIRRRVMLCHRILVLAAVPFVFVNSPVYAQATGDRVTCTGTLIDVWIRPKGSWPLAVIYDAANKLTCSINRGGSGHDPLKPCDSGERCRVTGSYRKFGSEALGSVTYSIQKIETVERINAQQ
jgi:hypothetical protein